MIIQSDNIINQIEMFLDELETEAENCINDPTWNSAGVLIGIAYSMSR